jgi:hypothetical protein
MPTVNPVVAENLRVGTVDWQLTRPARNREIEGYAGATSIDRGERIELFVHTAAPTYTLEVFRMGWYDGLGARRVFGPVTLQGTQQPMPATDPETGLVDCAWKSSFSLQAGSANDASDWVSGIYLARLTAGDSGAQSYIVFVVRDDQRSAGLLYQQSVTTYQAYNAWGG